MMISSSIIPVITSITGDSGVSRRNHLILAVMKILTGLSFWHLPSCFSWQASLVPLGVTYILVECAVGLIVRMFLIVNSMIVMRWSDCIEAKYKKIHRVNRFFDTFQQSFNTAISPIQTLAFEKTPEWPGFPYPGKWERKILLLLPAGRNSLPSDAAPSPRKNQKRGYRKEAKFC